jgi:hypothetical protein
MQPGHLALGRIQLCCCRSQVGPDLIQPVEKLNDVVSEQEWSHFSAFIECNEVLRLNAIGAIIEWVETIVKQAQITVEAGSAEEVRQQSYSNTLLIKLSSSGFKIDPETPLEVSSDALPIRRSWTISPNSEGKHTLVLSFSKPTAVGLAKLNDAPVRPEEAFKLSITVYTIYGIPLWMVNTLGALAALGGTAVAWGPFAAWLYERQACRPAGVREPVKARSDAVQSRKPLRLIPTSAQR